MENPNIGDIVYLKGSDVPMTIEKVKEKEIYCVWFEQDKLCRKTFPKNDLVLIRK